MSEYLTLAELAERTKLSTRTLKRAIARSDRQRLPSYLVGRRRLVKALDADKWIEQHKDMTGTAKAASALLARLR